MKTYTTVQGDTWDYIAYKLYGSENYMKQLIEANYDLLDTLIFEANVTLNVPEIGIEISNDEDQPYWRSVEKEDGEDSLFSSEDLAVDAGDSGEEDD